MYLYFCIAHVSITKNNIWREIILFRTWSTYLVEMDGMFLRTSNVEAAHIYGVYVILILGAL